MPQAKIEVDLTRVDEREFAPDRPLAIAAIKNGVVIDQKVVTPAKEKDPRRVAVSLNLGDAEDGAFGADVAVAPAGDDRNLLSGLAARKFVAGTNERTAASIAVLPGVYTWWRFCWFPRTYRITGRVVRNVDNCVHPVAGATVEIYDVDYCWWWFNQDLLRTVTTDANGFFDATFTWCVPLWCLFEIVRQPPILIDPTLRDRILAALKPRIKIPFPWPPPPDPIEWERQLIQLGIDVPAAGGIAVQNAPVALRSRQIAAPASALQTVSNARIQASDIFSSIIRWRPCDNPCDWQPDIKIRVTQNQPSGTVVIYEDSYSDIRFNLAGDLLNITLQANANALYAAACNPNPILGNCMLLDAVGTIQIMPVAADPQSGIYQPDVSAGSSYGVTPDRRQRLGYVKNYDRPWMGTLSVYGRFGIAAGVDYYQVQMAKWTAADILAWDADHTHVPPTAAFAPVPVSLLGAFTRSYEEESPLPLHWRSETFAPQTVGGVPSVYKTRERFEQEYRAAHGGNDPAPNFGGWYWYYFTETRLFDLVSAATEAGSPLLENGLYTFRLVCYRQTGVDGGGNPILTQVNMGIAGGVGRRCTTTKPELVTLYIHNTPHVADCAILNFRKNGVDIIDECAMVTLTPSDYIEIEYRAQDPAGHLDSYAVSLQKGASSPASIFGLAGVTAVTGSAPEGPNYGAALADPMTPAIPPYWYGGSWKKRIPYSTFHDLGGSCAYLLSLRAWDRHTDGFSAGPGWGATECGHDRAFTVILA